MRILLKILFISLIATKLFGQNGYINIYFSMASGCAQPYTGHAEVRKISDNSLIQQKDWSGGEYPVTLSNIPSASSGTYKVIVTPPSASYNSGEATVGAVSAGQGTNVTVSLTCKPQNGYINIYFSMASGCAQPYTGHAEVRKVSDNSLIQQKDWSGGEYPVTLSNIPSASSGTYKVIVTPPSASYNSGEATVGAVSAGQGTNVTVSLTCKPQNGYINIYFSMASGCAQPYTGHAEVRKISDNSLIQQKDWSGGEYPVTLSNIPSASSGTYKVIVTPPSASYNSGEATVGAVSAGQGTNVTVSLTCKPQNGYINIYFSMASGCAQPYTGHAEVRKVSDNSLIQQKDWSGGEYPVTLSNIPSASSGTYKVIVTPPSASYNSGEATVGAVSAGQGTNVTVSLTCKPQNGYINIYFSMASGCAQPYTGHAEVRKISDNSLIQQKDWSGGEYPVTLSNIPSASSGTYKVILSLVGNYNPDEATVGEILVDQGTDVAVNIRCDVGGELVVTITPQEAITAGAQWRVDGGEWRNSGTSVIVSVGNHTVSYKDVAGWEKPADQVVDVNSLLATQITANYKQQGELVVTITPQEAITAGARWRVDGGEWRNSGTSVIVSVGNHTVSYKDVAGWEKPADQVVDVNSLLATQITANYKQQGELVVTITPQEAITAGAQWRVDGGEWRNSGTSVIVSVGNHTVSYKDVAGWEKPADQVVDVNSLLATQITANYKQQGELVVTITPQEAITAGAQWRVDGGGWRNSGTSVIVSVGNHTVSYEDVPCWQKPGDRSVDVNNMIITEITGTYVLKPLDQLFHPFKVTFDGISKIELVLAIEVKLPGNAIVEYSCFAEGGMAKGGYLNYMGEIIASNYDHIYYLYGTEINGFTNDGKAFKWQAKIPLGDPAVYYYFPGPTPNDYDLAFTLLSKSESETQWTVTDPGYGIIDIVPVSNDVLKIYNNKARWWRIESREFIQAEKQFLSIGDSRGLLPPTEGFFDLRIFGRERPSVSTINLDPSINSLQFQIKSAPYDSYPFYLDFLSMIINCLPLEDWFNTGFDYTQGLFNSWDTWMHTEDVAPGINLAMSISGDLNNGDIVSAGNTIIDYLATNPQAYLRLAEIIAQHFGKDINKSTTELVESLAAVLNIVNIVNLGGATAIDYVSLYGKTNSTVTVEKKDKISVELWIDGKKTDDSRNAIAIFKGKTIPIKLIVKNNNSYRKLYNVWVGLDIYEPLHFTNGVNESTEIERKLENTLTPILDDTYGDGIGRYGRLDLTLGNSPQGLHDIAPGESLEFLANYNFNKTNLSSSLDYWADNQSYSFRIIIWQGGYPGQSSPVSSDAIIGPIKKPFKIGDTIAPQPPRVQSDQLIAKFERVAYTENSGLIKYVPIFQAYWEANPVDKDIYEYLVYGRAEGWAEPILISSILPNLGQQVFSYIDTVNAMGRKYYYSIKTRDIKGNISDFSSAIFADGTFTNLEQPSLILPDDGSSSEIPPTFSWQANQINVNGYRLSISRRNDMLNIIIDTTITSSTTTSCQLSRAQWEILSANSSYYWSVRCLGNNNTYSNWAAPRIIIRLGNKVAIPIINPSKGSFPPSILVAITSETAGATIRFTLDGSEPTTASQQYDQALLISSPIYTSNVTLKAKAWKDPLTPSEFASVTYSFIPNNKVAAPIIAPSSGLFLPVINVGMTCATSGATIRYTLDGTDPASSSQQYTGTISINSPPYISNVLLKAKGWKDGLEPSDISTGNYSYSGITLKLNSPNGGESWQVGSSHNITWTSSGITNVKLDYTTDNGNSWSLIISDALANMSSYSWSIPNMPSSRCKVKISDVSNSSLTDMSDNEFNIVSDLQPTTLFFDDFNDGDFTNNPNWNFVGNNGCGLGFGTAEVINGEFHVLKTGSPGCGNVTQIEHGFDFGVTDSTKIIFDVNPVFSDVGDGAGWTNEEYPAFVDLRLWNASGDSTDVRFCYNYRGGVSHTNGTTIFVVFPSVPQNVWQRNQMFRLRDYVPNAMRMSKIIIGGIGWDYEAYFDNITITTQAQFLTSPILISPKNNSIGISSTPLFDWNDLSGATDYRLTVSTALDFAMTVFDTSILSNSEVRLPSGKLTPGIKYYWRVRGSYLTVEGPWSEIWDFTVSNDTSKIYVLMLTSADSTVNYFTTLLDTLQLPYIRVRATDVASINFSNSLIIAGFSTEPLEYQAVASTIIDAVNNGSRMIAEAYGTYILTYAGLGSMSLGYWGPVVLDRFAYINKITESPIFAEIPTWDPPNRPDKPEQFMTYLTNTGLIVNADYQIPQAAQVDSMKFWLLVIYPGWPYAPTNSEYCQAWGGCTPERTVYLSWCSVIHYGNGRIFHYTGSPVSDIHHYGPILKAIHKNFINMRTLVTSVRDNHENKAIPSSFGFTQNYPNPFNPATTFKFELPVDSRVSLKVYNVLGQVVQTLVDGIEPAGYRSIEWNASNVVSGVYFYRIEATSISDPSKSFTLVKKMLLLK